MTAVGTTHHVARLRVDEPDLEVALRSDLGKQGRQVVAQVIGGGRWPVGDDVPTVPQPVPEADPGRRTPRIRARGAPASMARPAPNGRRPSSRLSPVRAAGTPVRAGSRSQPDACRLLFHPVGRPALQEELAKAAISAGPIGMQQIPSVAWFANQRCAGPARGGSACWSTPASTLTCTEAVDDIISRPDGPQASRYLSIAVYRGLSVIRRGGRNGSTPDADQPGALSCGPAPQRRKSRCTTSTVSARVGPGRELSSTCPPGSTVNRPSTPPLASSASRDGKRCCGKCAVDLPRRWARNDQQFEFDADLVRRAVLETGTRDPGLRRRLGQSRMVLGGCGVGWHGVDGCACSISSTVVSTESAILRTGSITMMRVTQAVSWATVSNSGSAPAGALPSSVNPTTDSRPELQCDRMSTDRRASAGCNRTEMGAETCLWQARMRSDTGSVEEQVAMTWQNGSGVR